MIYIVELRDITKTYKRYTLIDIPSFKKTYKRGYEIQELMESIMENPTYHTEYSLLGCLKDAGLVRQVKDNIIQFNKQFRNIKLGGVVLNKNKKAIGVELNNRSELVIIEHDNNYNSVNFDFDDIDYGKECIRLFGKVIIYNQKVGTKEVDLKEHFRLTTRKSVEIMLEIKPESVKIIPLEEKVDMKFKEKSYKSKLDTALTKALFLGVI